MFAVVALLLAGCASTVATAPPETAPPAAPTPATASSELPTMSGSLHWVRDSSEYRADLIQTYRLAGEALEELAAGREPGTWAVALDADETVIDNSLYQKEREALGEGFDRESWAAWTARREAPPLPGAVEFLERVRALGGTIAIVTNRDDELCPDTEADFEAFGIPYDVILCRVHRESPKEKRWKSIEDGTSPLGPPGREILMWLGDNIGDFPGQTQDLRLAPAEAYDAFGRRWFVLPNPVYGSWQGNPKQ
jgi:5'-nucleotidase (lipoprotein e(P4) family)